MDSGKGSRSASKTNLNESTLPLLDDVEVHDKEKIELKEKASTGSDAGEDEKDDSKTEKAGSDGKVEDGEGGGEAITDEPKKKKKAGCHKRAPSCVQKLSVGVNILDRDEKHINDDVNIAFEDVIAEPDHNQTFDAIWRLTFIVFTGTKLWIYRILAAIIALPCAICWGFNFALLSLCNVWAVVPCLRVLEINFRIIKRVWSAIIRTFIDPCFESAAMLCGNIRVRHVTEA